MRHLFELAWSSAGIFIKKFLEYGLVLITLQMNQTFIYIPGKPKSNHSFVYESRKKMKFLADDFFIPKEKNSVTKIPEIVQIPNTETQSDDETRLPLNDFQSKINTK